MYVNMHELASLAASRAQEMQQLPPPPPPASSASNDKVSFRAFRLWILKDSNAIYDHRRLTLRKKMAEVWPLNLAWSQVAATVVRLRFLTFNRSRKYQARVSMKIILQIKLKKV